MKQASPIELSPPIAALIAELLHELGQPLTTLQGCRLLPLLAAADRDELAAEMAEQVERATALYRELRHLLEAAAAPCSDPCIRLTLQLLIEDAAAECRRQAGRRDVTLALELPAAARELPAAGRHTGHALENVLTAGLACATPGGILRLIAAGPQHRRRGAVIEIALEANQPQALSVPWPPAGTSVAMRVAESLLKAEGGHMVYNLQPFRATIELPGAATLPATDTISKTSS